MRKFLPLKQRILVLIAAMAGIATIITVFVVLPAIKKISTLGNQIEQTEKFLEAQYQRTKQVRRSILSIDGIEEAVLAYAEATIRRGEELRVLTELEAIAEKNHIEQTLGIQFAEGNASGPKKKTIELPSFTLSFVNRGSFADHMKYLRSLEQLPYYVFIEKLTWERQTASRKSAAAPSGALVLKFDAKIYVKNK